MDKALDHLIIYVDFVQSNLFERRETYGESEQLKLTTN